MRENPPRYSEPAKAYFADDAAAAVKDFVEELLDENVITDQICTYRVSWQEVLMGFESVGTRLHDIPNWQKWFKQVEKNPDGNYALRRY